MVVDFARGNLLVNTIFDSLIIFMTDLLKDRLTKTRAAMGWSQQELAEASGVAAAQISRYESGRSEPRPEVIGKLAKALDVQFDWLARGVGPVEGGNPERKLPAGSKALPLDLSDGEYDRIAAFAEQHGLTKEMAVRKLLLEGLKALLGETEVQDGSSMSDLQRRIRENTELLQELRSRMELVESGSKT